MKVKCLRACCARHTDLCDLSVVLPRRMPRKETRRYAIAIVECGRWNATIASRLRDAVSLTFHLFRRRELRFICNSRFGWGNHLLRQCDTRDIFSKR